MCILIYRLHHAFQNAQEKARTIYQGKSAFHSFHVSEFWDVVKRVGDRDWHKHHTELLALYGTRQVGLGFLCEVQAKSPFEVWQEVASRKDIGVQSHAGNSETIISLAEYFKEDTRICADITALFMFYELQLGEKLVKRFGKILIAASTEDMIIEARDKSLQFNKTGIVPQKLQDFIDYTRVYTETCLPPTLGMNSIEKDELDKACGKSFIDTILLAEKEGALLYSEDYITKLIAANEHKIIGINSQTIIYRFLIDGLIEQEGYESYIIRLVKHNIRHTSINHLTLARTLEISGWKYEEPFSVVLNVIAGKNTTFESAIHVAMMFLMTLWTKIYMPETEKQKVTVAVLEVLCTERVIAETLGTIARLARLSINKFQPKEIIAGSWKILDAVKSFKEAYRI